MDSILKFLCCFSLLFATNCISQSISPLEVKLGLNSNFTILVDNNSKDIQNTQFIRPSCGMNKAFYLGVKSNWQMSAGLDYFRSSIGFKRNAFGILSNKIEGCFRNDFIANVGSLQIGFGKSMNRRVNKDQTLFFFCRFNYFRVAQKREKYRLDIAVDSSYEITNSVVITNYSFFYPSFGFCYKHFFRRNGIQRMGVQMEMSYAYFQGVFLNSTFEANVDEATLKQSFSSRINTLQINISLVLPLNRLNE